MKSNVLFKNFFMEIKSSLGRFLSIFFIVVLGVAFFSGIRVTEPDMRYTMDDYYDRQNLSDIKVFSTYGVNNDEVEDLSQIANIKVVEGGYTKDFFTTYNEDQIVLNVSSLLKSLNKVEVSQGRLPHNINECIVDSSLTDIKLGDSIKFDLPEKEKIDKYINTDSYKVVGKVNSPEYIGFNRGNTNMGTGVVDGFAFILPEAFNMDVFSGAYVKVKGAKPEIAYTKGYDNIVDDSVKRIENTTDNLAQRRTSDLKNEAAEKVDKRQKKAQRKLDKAQKDILSAEKELSSNKNKLNNSKNEIREGRSQYDSGLKKYNSGREKYDKNLHEYNKQNKLYNKSKTKLDNLKSQIEKLEDIYNKINNDPSQANEAAKLKGQIDALTKEYSEGTSRIRKFKGELARYKKALDTSKSKLDKSEKKLDESRQKIREGLAEIDNGETELTKAEKKLMNGKREIEEKQKELDEKIADARQKVSDIKSPKWYVEDRSVYPDYEEYGDNAERIGKIGKVFPVIFFLVAALVCLTAMTRFVEEQRMEIGTLKSLGYSKLQIATKYISYTLLATVTGSISGILLGEKIFPLIIINAYKMMYSTLPAVKVPYDIGISAYAMLLAVLSTLIATLAVTFKELRENPASLMRPPTPKNGNRILIERITFLWSKLNFIWKATSRNIFRYKKRFFMTVLGIAACMALLITGYGIKDSIYDITQIQYSEIQTYDGTVYYDEDISNKKIDKINRYVNGVNDIEKTMNTYSKNYTVKHGNSDWDAYIFVPEDISKFHDFIKLRDRKTHKEYSVKNEGAIITEKLAKELNVKKGDSITIDNYDTKIMITDIAENYPRHYVYVSPSTYNKVFNKPVEYNSLMFDTKYEEESKVQETGKQLLDRPGSLRVQYNFDLKEQMNDMIETISEVIIVLIVSAALLAFVVLYNLNVINISERTRELATIKVLGFYNMEVAKYVFRENVILTLIGILGGIVFGIFLHQYIIQTVEIEDVMFGRVIEMRSFVYSIVLTILFSLLVNIVMYFKLKKIDMVESLKSVE